MKTVFVGGGSACQAVLEMVAQKRLAALSPEVIGVVDPKPDAPGMLFAHEQGWPTFTHIEEAIDLDGLELVIELTGIDEVHDEVARLVAGRARIMDHKMARVFWDLDGMARHLRQELKKKTKLDEELRDDRRRLQELLDSLPDSVMVLDKEGRIERVNRRFEELTHLSSEKVTGLQCTELCKIDTNCTSSNEICPGSRVLETGGSVMVVQQNSCIRGIHANEECYYQTVANPIRNSLGELSVVITSREVTEQIRLARETEELARRARQILNAVHGIITITDLDGRLQFVNPSAEKFFGFSADKTEGKIIYELLPGDIAKIIKENDEVIIGKGGHLSHEEVLVFLGKEHILITERVMLYDYKDKPVGICRVARDVTTSRRLHQELLESEKHAAVGKLAAGVAHELNNPLTGILSFSEDLLEEIPDNTTIHEDISTIKREALRCRQIVRDLLDFSRQNKTNRNFIAIDSVVRRAIKLVEKQAAFHDIQFNIDLSEEPLRAFADQNQLQQVMLNLIINARDAMEGKGRISVVSKEISDNGGALISVTDNGCGISPDNLERIFEPFFSTKGDRGNGLGLAAVHSIVEEHGGAMTVESTVGKGSTFSIFLPAANRAEKAKPGRPHSILPAYHDWSEN
ncbi:MAG: PAS domain-containing protein [Proteobacteria bacterium]|nr:PAS domain-containing protein [Pseudomonadota bacterium]